MTHTVFLNLYKKPGIEGCVGYAYLNHAAADAACGKGSRVTVAVPVVEGLPASAATIFRAKAFAQQNKITEGTVVDDAIGLYVRLKPELRTAARRYAVEQGTTFEAVVGEALRAYLVPEAK